MRDLLAHVLVDCPALTTERAALIVVMGDGAPLVADAETAVLILTVLPGDPCFEAAVGLAAAADKLATPFLALHG